MGSTSSKFKKYLQHGDEFAAMQIYQSSPELRKNLDPNLSYGENHNHNTALHYAAKHGMKHLLRTFLNDLGGNPNKKNASNESVLHCACQLNQTKSFSAKERRATCVQLLLFWKGSLLPGGGREKIDLGAQDKDGNTALHSAASTGLKRCVELLLAHGAPLFVENNDKLTPCDLAMRGSHHDIARLLESRMVFADNSDVVNEDDEIYNEQEEVYCGLRSQDLQEAKDQLLVDTSDMLKIPLFTAEALLRNNEWSRELLLEKWMKDPVECCQAAGVQAPCSVLKHASSFDSSISAETTEDIKDSMCDICYSTISHWESPVNISCKHTFCKTCWESYLTTKIQDGDAHHILCPAYQCPILVPVELIEKLVSPDMARRYLQFDIKAFVESNKSIKWCPIAGCGRAVRLPEAEQRGIQIVHKSIPTTSHAVDCGNAHFFCWECLGEAHAPCGCKQWQEWQIKIAAIKPEELKASCSGSEDAANYLWLVTNSKPCPNCKSPIQKNEGCNHMKCSKCKFDFCWVCQEPWKRHSSATGGYFRCNRFEAVHKADEKQGTLISEALDRNNQMQELTRFLHFYTRYKNHENSRKLEEPLLTSVRQKMDVLASSLGLKSSDGEKGTKFIEDGVRELLKARRVLCGSYVYGYYLEDENQQKQIFEFMQHELEVVTEKLSEMIARPYLRTPKAVIVQTTALARRKRHEFARAVSKGFVPPETPINQRKKMRKYFDSDLTQTSTWLRDCECPEYDSDEENEMSFKYFSNSDPTQDGHHHYGLLCSSRACRRSDHNVEMEQLTIALEMSRLQLIADQSKQDQSKGQTNVITPDPGSSISNNSNESIDDQLRLAIHLSLQESTKNVQKDAENSRTDRNQKSSADLTVDYFLKSLANRIDFKGLDVVDKHSTETDRELFFRPCNGNEDGRFQIGDIHEKGFAFEDNDEYETSDIRLKRSHSTGDLCIRKNGRGTRVRTNRDEPRYHLDSDHSSQHDDKPEDLARRILALPSTSVRTKQFLLLHQTYPEEESYQGQSSVEDTTTSDSMNADMEVCGILSSITDDDIVGHRDELKKTDSVINLEECKNLAVSNPLASIKAKLTQPSKTAYLTKIAVNKSIGLLSEKSKDERRECSPTSIECQSEKHSPKTIRHTKCCRKSSFSKSTSFLVDQKKKISSNLRIKICKGSDNKTDRTLETDSSNEYESETGIPKSPTLFISGVSICRTPEPKSPGMVLATGGRQSRSSSLSVPIPLTSCALSISSSSLNSGADAGVAPPPVTGVRSAGGSPARTAKDSGGKSKSASEPEREREMFRFPKSSTDGALSSVLHIQESNLSSDDFHEALFLLERSPKTRDSKRRKKAKKKEKDEKKEDVSSVL